MEKTKDVITLKCTDDAEAHAAYLTLVDPAAKEEQWVDACSVLESKGMLAEIPAAKSDSKVEERSTGLSVSQKRPALIPLARRTALTLLLLLAVERGCYHLGIALHKQHVNAVANKLLAVSCHINPLDSSAHAERALVLNELDMTPVAVKEANEALILDNRNVDARIALGQVAAATWISDPQLLQRAKAEMNSAARMQPDNGYAWFLLGALEQKDMDAEHARIYYQRAIDLGYTQSGILARMAGVQKDDAGKIDWYSAAIALNGADPSLLDSRASCYERLGHHELAAADYEKASRLAAQNKDWPAAADFVAFASTCYFNLGHYLDAYTAADTALKFAGDNNPSYQRRRGKAALRMDRLQEASDDFEQCGLFKTASGYWTDDATTNDYLMAAECLSRLGNRGEMEVALDHCRQYGATEHDIELVRNAFGKQIYTAKYDEIMPPGT